MNYKAITNETITVAGIKRFVPPEATIKFLYDDVSLSGAPDTFIDLEDGLVYKTDGIFHAIALFLQTKFNGTFQLYEGVTEDAVTTIKASIRFGDIGTPMNHEFYFNNLTIASEKFVVHDPIGISLHYATLIGYEMP